MVYFISSDVMKLVKIRMRRMQILTFKICGMRIEAFIFSVGT